MTIFDYLKNKIRKWLKVEQLDTNPNDQRFTYISDDDKIKEQKLKEYRIWYIGDSDELLNYYTVRETFANCENPIYNRNRQNYFWGISSEEGDIKRVHSGIPNAIVTTLVNAIGMPKICSKSAVVQKALDDILEENDFTNNTETDEIDGINQEDIQRWFGTIEQPYDGTAQGGDDVQREESERR